METCFIVVHIGIWWNVNMICSWPDMYKLFEFYNKYQNLQFYSSQLL